MIEFTDNTRAYTVIETAQILKRSLITVRKYLRDGKLHGEMLKHKIYIDETEIERFIKEEMNK